MAANADLYKDMLLKLKYYKEEIIKSFIKRGYFPETSDITAALSRIEFRTALCESHITKKGALFNTKEMNNTFELIYKDIVFLYAILQDILVNDYNNLKLFIEAHLSELESKAELYRARMDEEINTQVFGTMLLFQTNEWNVNTENDVTIIDLGEVEILQGSEIALFANINNIENDKVYFDLKANDEQLSFKALPYNYNQDTYLIPGEITVKKYELTINDRTIINDNISVNMEVNSNNDYIFLGGIDTMIVTSKGNNAERIVHFPYANRPFVATEDCYLEFFIVDGKGKIIDYNFNMSPVHCNFSTADGSIKLTKDIQRFFMEVKKGFVFYFNIEEGNVFASKKDGVVTSPNTLLYKGNWNLRDFEIREYIKDKVTTYNVKMYIQSDKEIVDSLNSAYIKQIK